MRDTETKNLLWRLLAILVGALVGAGADLALQLGGTGPILWRHVAAAGLGPLITGLATLPIPQAGMARLAAQARRLRSFGVEPHQMRVIGPHAVPAGAAPAGPPPQSREGA